MLITHLSPQMIAYCIIRLCIALSAMTNLLWKGRNDRDDVYGLAVNMRERGCDAVQGPETHVN